MNRKPQPLYRPRNRKHCPVCGKVSFSAAGIHPQCAMDQADAKRMQKVKPRRKLSRKATTVYVQPWQKICPRCRLLVHVRQKVCECGYAFAQTGSR